MQFSKRVAAICVFCCGLLYAVSGTAVPPEMPASQRMNQLMDEMMQANASGDRARVEAIAREIQALTPQVKAEQDAALEQARQRVPASTQQNMQNLMNQLQAQQQSPEWKISLAARKGDLAEVKRLRQAGAEINFYRLDPGPPLMEAAIHGHVDVAKYLLVEGAPLRVRKSIVVLDALRLAAEAREDNSAMLKLLTQHGALSQGDIENIGSAVLKDAEAQGQRHMQMEGKQITSGSALMGAIEKGRVLHVKTLLELGANANDWAFGKSALMLAARKLNPEMVELLLRHDADLSLTGPESKTALQFAEAVVETPQNRERRQRVIALLRTRG